MENAVGVPVSMEEDQVLQYKSFAKQKFEDCPLIEIVHFHECLRGELRSLQSNLRVLHDQMLSVRNQGVEGKGGKVAPPHEHIALEIQVQSQFQLLWAVFQSHSTAEDETIWPALKEKARSSGGKLQLINHNGSDDKVTSTKSQTSGVDYLGQLMTTAQSVNASGKGTGADGDKGVGRVRVEFRDGGGHDEGGIPGIGSDDGSGEGGGVAMGLIIDEQEYTEEHSQEQRLFEGMQELFTDLRSSRQNLSDRMGLLEGLKNKMDEMCEHLFTHLDKEEESALPLIKHYFTPQEMETLVGKIMGKRPSELMQAILAMIIKNLPPEEVWTMMGYMRHAVKDTYFEKWLAWGGFEWPMIKVRKDKEGKAKGASHRGMRPFQTRTGFGSICESRAESEAVTNSTGVALQTRKRLLSSASDGCGSAAGVCNLCLDFGGINLTQGKGLSTLPGGCGGDVETKIGKPKMQKGGAGPTVVEAGSVGQSNRDYASRTCGVCAYVGRCPANEPLTQAEFEAAVKCLAHVPHLSTSQKNDLVQSFRNHMYESHKRPRPLDTGGGSQGHCGSQRLPSSWLPHPASPLGGKVQASKTRCENRGNTCGEGKRLNPNVSGWAGRRGLGGKGHWHGQSQGNEQEALVLPNQYYTSTQPDIDCAGGCTGDAGRLILSPRFTKEELSPMYHIAPPVVNGRAGASKAVVAGESRGGGVLGCPHYRRACKLRAPCCQKLFTCRLCHDQVSNHAMDRQSVTEMLCMRCGTLQPVQSNCNNPKCQPAGGKELGGSGDHVEEVPGMPGQGEERNRLARYYCEICHLFDDAPDKDIYHCPYCNMCRLGKGLGVDFFHCMTCNACISIGNSNHTCLSKSLESDCPICHSSLFSSTSQVKGLKCGHFMHLHCYKEYIRRSDAMEFWYRCPICRKSMDDMQEYFSQMDAVVASQPMPEEYSSWKSKVLCHDCDQITEVPYHFYYLKCGSCGSYNTRAEGQVPPEGVVQDDHSGAGDTNSASGP